MNQKYDFDYFHSELLKLQNTEYNEWIDKTEWDVLLCKINSEDIYNFYDIDWEAFTGNIVTAKYRTDSLTYKIIESEKISQLCDRIYSRDLRVKT